MAMLFLFSFCRPLFIISFMSTIHDIRKEYMQLSLLETDAEKSPFAQFQKWWGEAIQSGIEEVNAMTLSTSTKMGVPSARIVLLKDFSEGGFVFFTNHQSKKGLELEENPLACLVFFWKELERQVRINGQVEKIPENESDKYFASRPRGSQIGAWASPQSQFIDNREVIEKNLERCQEQFGESEIPRPPHWGGYIVKPTLIEFWQGRESRLHDRIQYRLENGGWKKGRLAP